MSAPNSTCVRAVIFALSFAISNTAMAEDYGYPAKYYNPGWVFSPPAATAKPLVQRIAAIAHPVQNYVWTDMSKPHGGYDPNSPEGNRAFWDYQGRQGK